MRVLKTVCQRKAIAGVDLQSIRWDRRDEGVSGLPGAPEADEYGEVYRCGSTAALLAFGAQLAREVRPLLIRTGSEWRCVQRGQKELLGQKTEPVELEIECVVVDFSAIQ